MSNESFPDSQINAERFSLKGRVALVTGSSTGIGYAIATGLGEAGAKVALNYANNRQRAEAAFAKYRAAGLEGALFRANVIDPSDVQRLARDISSQLGPVDILIINATPDQPELPIEQYDWEFHQSMLDFFVKSPYLLTRAVLPHMKQQQWGRIINIGSEVFNLGRPEFSAYVAAKGGQNGWTRSMSTELAPYGITVNMISPGWIPVERHANASQDAKDAYVKTVPAGRWGVTDDFKGISIFLSSDASSFISGQNIAVNGGLTVA